MTDLTGAVPLLERLAALSARIEALEEEFGGKEAAGRAIENIERLTELITAYTEFTRLVQLCGFADMN